MRPFVSIVLCFYTCFWAGAADLSLGIDAPQTLRSLSRERQCLNGLWKFCPQWNSDLSKTAPPPGSGWGYIKVPGVWPTSNTRNSAIQPLLSKEVMKHAAKWHSGWYRRTFIVPREAANKRAILDIELIQCRGTVYVDGSKAGEILFPGGELDITSFIKPGQTQTLEIHVAAIPLSQNHYIVMDGNNVYKVAAKVKNKGITGDVFLHFVPSTRLKAPHIITSTRKNTITVSAALHTPSPDVRYSLNVSIADPNGKTVKKFKRDFTAKDLKGGRISASAIWPDAKRWDLDTPENLYFATLTLSQDGKLIDQTLPERFGFREFYIEGRNYMLNGSPIHMRAYHLPNYSAEWMPDKASKEICAEAFKRLLSLGFNFSISRNYNFSEGAVNYLRGHCEAADEVGFLHSLSLPHPWQFGDLTQPENLNRYMRVAAYLMRKYWNHPSLVLWVTNHNHGGAWGDQNPLRIGGDYLRANSAKEVKRKEKSRNNFLAAQARITAYDPTRPVYSHASGSLGGQYSLNAYYNWAPKQERSDWLEHFSKHGKYPLSFVEWGLPHIASFSSYRWPKFIWSAKAPMTLWDAEYLAAEYGDMVAEWTQKRLAILNRQIRTGNKPIRWGTLAGPAQKLPGVIRLQADYYRDNLRNMRAFGIGILLPWDDKANYRPLTGKFPTKENPKRWQGLNAPGLVPDYSRWGDYILSPYKNKFKLSELGQVMKVWQQPQIAYIGGEHSFTTKEHNYMPGETVRKKLVIINDARRPTTCSWLFYIRGINAPPQSGKVTVAPGDKAVIPVSFRLPVRQKAGQYAMTVKFVFDQKTAFHDQFTIDVMSRIKSNRKPQKQIALYDPKGLTAKLLKFLKVPFRRIGNPEQCKSNEALVIGREALNATQAFPLLDQVRDGGKVLIFEQNGKVLKRLGFRYNEHGLRSLYLRSNTSPVVKGLKPEHLTDWRGESTLLPPYLDYMQFFAPTWKWCGFENTRVWRCRNRGTVANVLPEKPVIGNFTPLLDGGFALQYAPVLEYREGKGRIIFCQTEVCGRTAQDPAAKLLTLNLLDALCAPVTMSQSAAILGSEKFRQEILSYGANCNANDLSDAQVVIAGPGAEKYPDLTAAVKSGKILLMLGVTEADACKLLPDWAKRFGTAHNAPSQIITPGMEALQSINNLDAAFQTRLTYATLDGRELTAVKLGKGEVVFAGVLPQMLDFRKLFRLRSSYRRRAFLTAQLLRNAGIGFQSILLERFREKPVEKPWLKSYYKQIPIAGDDPYRYYHW